MYLDNLFFFSPSKYLPCRDRKNIDFEPVLDLSYFITAVAFTGHTASVRPSLPIYKMKGMPIG